MSVQDENLQNRAKLLDDREAFVKELEAKFANKLASESLLDVRLEVLDKQIASKQEVLAQVNSQIKDSQTKHQEAQEDLVRITLDINTASEAKEAQTRSKEAKLREQADRIDKLNRDITKLTGELSDRKKYLKEQEQIVNDTIADWNSQLNDFKGQAGTAENEKKDILREIITLDQQKTSLSHEIEEVEGKVVSLKEVYESRLQEVKGDLDELNDSIDRKNAQLKKLDEEIKIKEQGFMVRERGLTIKEQALTRREAELNNQQQLIDSRLSMV